MSFYLDNARSYLLFRKKEESTLVSTFKQQQNEKKAHLKLFTPWMLKKNYRFFFRIRRDKNWQYTRKKRGKIRVDYDKYMVHTSPLLKWKKKKDTENRWSENRSGEHRTVQTFFVYETKKKIIIYNIHEPKIVGFYQKKKKIFFAISFAMDIRSFSDVLTRDWISRLSRIFFFLNLTGNTTTVK